MKSLIVVDTPAGFNPDFTNCDFYKHLFKECGPLDKKSSGFIENVFGSYVERLSGGIDLMTIRTQAKTPKKSHIDSIVDEKISQIRNNTGNSPTKGEILSLRDDAEAEVLAKTHPNSPVDIKVFFLDSKFYVEVNSFKKLTPILDMVELLLDENFPYSQPGIEGIPEKFISYLNGSLPDPFILGDSTKLVDKDNRKIVISKGSIQGSVAEDLVKDGAQVCEMELEYDGSLMFKVTPELEILSIKFDKEFFSETKNDEGGSVIQQINEVVKMYARFTRELINGDDV